MSRCYRRGCVECATKQLLEITQGAAKQAEQQMEGHPEMTDIVEQATYLIHNASSSISLRMAGSLAQALADAGLLRDPARTVPHRDEVAAAIAQGYEPENPTPNRHDYRATDAVLELLAGQPTVNEAKAQALEEFAAHIENTAQRDDVRLTEHAVNDTGGAYLARERAQQIRDGK